jgi:hypothetical protein
MKYFIGPEKRKGLGANLLPRPRNCIVGTWKANMRRYILSAYARHENEKVVRSTHSS